MPPVLSGNEGKGARHTNGDAGECPARDLADDSCPRPDIRSRMPTHMQPALPELSVLLVLSLLVLRLSKGRRELVLPQSRLGRDRGAEAGRVEMGDGTLISPGSARHK